MSALPFPGSLLTQCELAGLEACKPRAVLGLCALRLQSRGRADPVDPRPGDAAASQGGRTGLQINGSQTPAGSGAFLGLV